MPFPSLNTFKILCWIFFIKITPWKLLDTTLVPGTTQEVSLHRRGNEYSIRVDGNELMNSRAMVQRMHWRSLPVACLAKIAEPRILIDGLGMGFTLTGALANLNACSRVVVAELLPLVVEWNQGSLSELAGNPLADERVVVREADVSLVLQGERRAYNAILLDVDNGPEGLTRFGNDWLYGDVGLQAAF